MPMALTVAPLFYTFPERQAVILKSYICFKGDTGESQFESTNILQQIGFAIFELF